MPVNGVRAGGGGRHHESSSGELNPKYPGGASALKKLLVAEGHTIVTRGKRAFVADYDKSLFHCGDSNRMIPL